MACPAPAFLAAALAGSVAAAPASLPEDVTLAPSDTSTVLVGDLDGDALPDTFGYTIPRPWDRVVCNLSSGRRWSRMPGAGLEDFFRDHNERLRERLRAAEPDSQAWWPRYQRYRIGAENVERGPVMAFGGCLVVMWYMEPQYPSGINTYDLDGNLLSRYVHPGHLRAMLPWVRDGRRYVAFGGTNNFLDKPSAARSGCKRLNLPVVGLVPLGADGVHASLVPELRLPPAVAVPAVVESLYVVADPDRNSQVLRLRAASRGEIRATYEHGDLRCHGYAARDSTVVVDIATLWGRRDGAAAAPRPED